VIATSTIKLAALVVPLGLDTLGVALTLGLIGMPPRRRLRIAMLFAGFEAAMPLVGVALGAPLGTAIGGAADYGAAALIIALGIYLLLADEEEETNRLRSLATGGLMSAVALGVSISLDELAIGFSAGLLRLPILALVIVIAVQAFVLTQVGLLVGDRAGERIRDAAERLAGGALIGLGCVLLIERLAR
jgi:manganese efflux pump family protein